MASTATKSKRMRAALCASLLGAFASVHALDTPPTAQLQYSADIGANLLPANGYVARQEYVIDTLDGARQRAFVPGLAARANLLDFHIDPDGALLFALDVGATLGGTYFRPGDVVRRKNGVFTKAFDAALAGVPQGVRCDGVARREASSLLLSFDRAFALGGVTILPADLVLFDGATNRGTVFDAKALGLPASLNVDAADVIGEGSDLLLSFDTGGQLGGVRFADEDIMQYTLATNTWSKRIAPATLSDRWQRANLDGLASAPNGGDLFRDSFEQE